MTQAAHRRQYIRAPLKTFVLYDDDHFGFKAQAINISTGGVLLENLPHVPEINALPLLLDIPTFPIFSSLSAEKIKKLEGQHLPRRIIRARARIVRSFEGQTDVDKIFVQKIGCQFVAIAPESVEVLSEYVANFAKNTIYLLTLFESHSQHQADLIRIISGLLGYRPDEKLSVLRQKVLHDYQSLEGL